MMTDFVLLHLIPFLGDFMQDPVQTVITIASLNIIILTLFYLCALGIRNRRRQQRAQKALGEVSGIMENSQNNKNLQSTLISEGESLPVLKYNSHAGKMRGAKKR